MTRASAKKAGEAAPEGRVHDDVEIAWRAERPDLDLRAAWLLMRVEQVNHFHELRVQEVSKKLHLSSGDLRVLLALRRSGKPFESRPTDLFRALYVSSGAITRRTVRLQSLGYILRVAANDDGRSELVRLTKLGLKATDTAISQIAEQTNRFRAECGLTDAELLVFDMCLRKMLDHETGKAASRRRKRPPAEA